MEKKGFIPEQGLGDVLGDVVSTGIGAHKNSSPFETIFFGKLRALTSILNGSQKEEVSQIIAGCHPLSKLISDSIDLDNIDNVFRMAYHMGLDFRKEAPIKLAESMFIPKRGCRFRSIWRDRYHIYASTILGKGAIFF